MNRVSSVKKRKVEERTKERKIERKEKERKREKPQTLSFQRGIPSKAVDKNANSMHNFKKKSHLL